MVKSDGSAIATPGVVPEITTLTTNTAPTIPASLVQKKTDDTVIPTGDWINATSVKFTATISDPDASDTLQLCVEKDILATSFSNTEDLCGSGVAYSGTPVAASVTIPSITDANEYHWQARVKDAGGLYSTWVSYDVNLETARDFGIDTTAPTGGTVFDGTSAGVDASFNDGSLSSLSANWSGFNAGASGLLRYEYSIGTTAGGTDIRGWTNNTTATSVTATGLTLQTSQMYFVNVRALDNAGNTQTSVSSNGQLVAPDLSFSVSPSTLTFANLNGTTLTPIPRRRRSRPPPTRMEDMLCGWRQLTFYEAVVLPFLILPAAPMPRRIRGSSAIRALGIRQATQASRALTSSRRLRARAGAR